MSRFVLGVAVLVLATLVGSPAAGQGKSQQSHGNNGKSPAGTQGPSTPNQSVLPAPASLSASTVTAPFAWMDGASLIAPGTVWVGISVVRWQGSGLAETNAPVVDGAIGLLPRVQIGATVPHVVGGSDPTTSPGGLGTTFFTSKIGVVGDATGSFRIAVSPTLEVLSRASIQAAPADQARVQWGLPVSVDADRGGSRFFGSAGYFSPGVWYLGAGLARQLADRVGVVLSLSRAWSSSPSVDATISEPKRHDITAGVSFDVTPHLGVFGSLGRTIATTPENGAGTTFGFGVSLTGVSSRSGTK
jgi:hypothetical protein